MSSDPPRDWTDREQWNRHHRAEARDTPTETATIRSLRYARFAYDSGRRVWFPGCGVDPGPTLFAAAGCQVLATDISSFAVDWQNAAASQPAADRARDWESFLEGAELPGRGGNFIARNQDFLTTSPDETFDVVINIRAFSPLDEPDQRRAAATIEACLRPGGHAIIEILNVQGPARNIVEDSLLAAGIYVPHHKATRRYRERLEATGITHVMVLGRPMIPHWGQYPDQEFAEREAADKTRLEALHAEYEGQLEVEAPKVRQRLADTTTKVAHVVYSTG